MLGGGDCHVTSGGCHKLRGNGGGSYCSSDGDTFLLVDVVVLDVMLAVMVIEALAVVEVKTTASVVQHWWKGKDT